MWAFRVLQYQVRYRSMPVRCYPSDNGQEALQKVFGFSHKQRIAAREDKQPSKVTKRIQDRLLGLPVVPAPAACCSRAGNTDSTPDHITITINPMPAAAQPAINSSTFRYVRSGRDYHPSRLGGGEGGSNKNTYCNMMPISAVSNPNKLKILAHKDAHIRIAKMLKLRDEAEQLHKQICQLSAAALRCGGQ
jgi:hypothetical protein